MIAAAQELSTEALIRELRRRALRERDRDAAAALRKHVIERKSKGRAP